MPQTRFISWVPAPTTIKRIDKVHTFLYRATFGLVGSRLDGLRVLLLTTRGRRTGRARRVPLPYFRDGDRYLLVGSFGGGAQNPAWIGNLLADPEVQVQSGWRRWQARARMTEGAERARLWANIAREFPRYADYQAMTSREIPVVVLE
jgi:deazaflavin-dependent oxidoreductase (nitroreductase family)